MTKPGLKNTYSRHFTSVEARNKNKTLLLSQAWPHPPSAGEPREDWKGNPTRAQEATWRPPGSPGWGLAGAKPVLLGKHLLHTESCFCLGACGPFWKRFSRLITSYSSLHLCLRNTSPKWCLNLATPWGVRARPRGRVGRVLDPVFTLSLRASSAPANAVLQAHSWRERVHTYGSSWEETKPGSHPSSV